MIEILSLLTHPPSIASPIPVFLFPYTCFLRAAKITHNIWFFCSLLPVPHPIPYSWTMCIELCSLLSGIPIKFSLSVSFLALFPFSPTDGVIYLISVLLLTPACFSTIYPMRLHSSQSIIYTIAFHFPSFQPFPYPIPQICQESIPPYAALKLCSYLFVVDRSDRTLRCG